jgi:hypothetical protein
MQHRHLPGKDGGGDDGDDEDGVSEGDSDPWFSLADSMDNSSDYGGAAAYDDIGYEICQTSPYAPHDRWVGPNIGQLPGGMGCQGRPVCGPSPSLRDGNPKPIHASMSASLERALLEAEIDQL